MDVSALAAPRPFRDVPMPASVRIPPLLVALVAVPMSVGAALELLGAHRSWRERLARAVFAASGLGYLSVSVADFAEHFRLEKQLTGRWLAAKAVPLGETLNHAATIAVVASLLVLARPFRRRLDLRDTIVVLAPAAFLALGWRDELVYHRRRAVHREDILHTVSHLAAAAMFAANAVVRLVDWRRAR